MCVLTGGSAIVVGLVALAKPLILYDDFSPEVCIKGARFAILAIVGLKLIWFGLKRPS